jgi:hypothetical protein
MSKDSKSLYIITRDIQENDVDDLNFWKNLLIFTNSQEALNELDNIYKNTPDFKYYNYHIKVYDKINNKYVVSHKTYYHQRGYSSK